jgi:thymidylate synthase
VRMPNQFEFENLGEGYSDLLYGIMEYGDRSAPRGKHIRELLGVTIALPDLRHNILVHPDRDLNYRFMIAEWFWIMAGRRDVASIVKYNKNYSQFSDDGILLSGAYGPRLAMQWSWLLNKFKEDPDTRQGILSIWTPAPGPSKDIPCTISLQFFLRQGKLHEIVTMRSSDAWWGLPYDLFTFAQIGNCLAGELGVEPGGLVMQLGSCHLYEPFWEDAAKVGITQDKAAEVVSPTLPNLPLPTTFEKMLVGHHGSPFPLLAPWSHYTTALNSKNRASALEVLREAAKLG